MKVKHPAAAITWRDVASSNVERVGWDRHAGMYVRFKGGSVYRYAGVSRQRAVACAFAVKLTKAESVGVYVNRLKKSYPCTKIGGQE